MGPGEGLRMTVPTAITGFRFAGEPYKSLMNPQSAIRNPKSEI
jgi:hypothetical protein